MNNWKRLLWSIISWIGFLLIGGILRFVGDDLRNRLVTFIGNIFVFLGFVSFIMIIYSIIKLFSKTKIKKKLQKLG